MNQVLEECGLTKNEAKLYITSLKIGPSKAGELIKKTGFQSSVTYHLLATLTEKGLISYTNTSTQKIYTASDPNQLKKILEEKQNQLKQTTKKIDKLLPELQTLKESHNEKRLVQVHEGIPGIKRIFNDIITTSKHYMVLGGTGNFTKLVPSYKSFLRVQKRKQKIKQQNLLYGSPKKQYVESSLQDTKYLDPQNKNPELNLPFSFISYNDKLAIINYEHKDPQSILIENPTIAKAFQNLFNLIWDKTK